ncbi:class I adenylate-forming enzyme family protein [Archaeoglobus neptunius]|uniref:class I adenylate-forming enzyme family protein n=1 Tax=Archaeoglobus neptunius TaxID=2798580 RepID=UPI002ED7B4B3
MVDVKLRSAYPANGSVYNVSKVIARNAEVVPDKTAVIDAGKERSFTYKELNLETNKLANALLDYVEKGDRVFVLMQNGIETLETILACLKIDAVYTPANFRLSDSEIEFLINDARPKVLIYDAAFSDKIERIRPKSIQLIEVSEKVKLEAESFYELIKASSDEEPEISTEPDDLSMILFTAGTTGRPKGVKHTHRSIFFASLANHMAAELTPDDVYYGAPPMFHAGGITCFQLSTLMFQGTTVLKDRWEAKESLEIIKKYGVTFLFGIATQFKMMIQVEGWENYVQSLRAVCGGGEPQPRELREAFIRLGIKYLGGYGLTETGATGVCGPAVGADHPILEKGSECVGLPPPFVEVKIVDESGNEVERGKIGEIVVRQEPTGAVGYWNRPEDEKKKFKDGWIFTGDIGMIDEEGYIYVMGRVDDMIISGGENIYPAEIEKAIYSHPKVADVVVVRGKHEVWGQTPKAIVVPKRGESLTPEEIQEHVAKILGSFKKPRKVVIVDELPKAETGKIDKRRVKELYEEV